MGRFGGIEGAPLQFDPGTLGEQFPGVCGHHAVVIKYVDIDGYNNVPLIAGQPHKTPQEAEAALYEARAYQWENSDMGRVGLIVQGETFTYSEKGPVLNH